jgi:hypothetical protein
MSLPHKPKHLISECYSVIVQMQSCSIKIGRPRGLNCSKFFNVPGIGIGTQSPQTFSNCVRLFASALFKQLLPLRGRPSSQKGRCSVTRGSLEAVAIFACTVVNLRQIVKNHPSIPQDPGSVRHARLRTRKHAPTDDASSWMWLSKGLADGNT